MWERVISQSPIVMFCGPVTLLESVLELATIVTEYVAPKISPADTLVLASVAPARTVSVAPPSCSGVSLMV